MRATRGQGIDASGRPGNWLRRHPGTTIFGILLVLAIWAIANSGTPSGPSGTSPPGQAPATRQGVNTYLDLLQKQAEGNSVASLGTLHIGTVRYDHGVSIAYDYGSPSNPDYVTFALPGRFKTFRALVGFDPSVTSGDSYHEVVTVVAGDRVVVSTVVSTGSPPCTIDAPIGGATTLELETWTSGNSGGGTDVAFGDPRVLNGADFSGMPTASQCP